MTRDVAIVFARVPRLGTVKRRLARDIGDRAALRFHRSVLDALLRDLIRDRRMLVVAALTPDRARTRLPKGVRRINQGHGDLGARMARCFARFPRRRVALLGSDIPAANAKDLRSAFKALGRADAVFGSALDGGYWLVAMGPRRPARAFAKARWSTRHALADTLANFRGQRVTFVRPLSDVDTAAEYHAWRQSAATPSGSR